MKSSVVSRQSSEALDEAAQHPAQLARAGQRVHRARASALTRALQPVLGLEGGAASDEEQAPLIRRPDTTGRLGDVRADRVRSPHELYADGPAIERVPRDRGCVYLVGELHGSPVDDEVSKRSHDPYSRHTATFRPAELTTDD